MGCLICEVCGEVFGLDIERCESHKCEQQRLVETVKTLKTSVRETTERIQDASDKIQYIISLLPNLEGKTLEIKKKDLDELWNIIRGDYKLETAEMFLSRWLLTHRILCETFDLFSTKRQRLELRNANECLHEVRKAVLEAAVGLGYDVDDELVEKKRVFITVHELIAELKSWKDYNGPKY